MAIDFEQCRKNFRQRATAREVASEKLRQQAREMAIAAIFQVIPQYPCIREVHLFGSITQPRQFHDHSDIDIAVGGTDATTYFAVWRDLEVACPNWLIDLREINQPSHFTDTVRRIGELVYESTNSTAQS
ncbi:MAG: nucleotidyltransferase domain-containing protein [Leptolyngbyaceae cyanobacterium SL_7_1]|nr:nucleotidyltransferase domain-containing protein [Leptolyngbyaceae cyanobacterium SL_7_1]